MIIYEDVLREFQKNRVKYVIVGGLALNLLGARRVTYDLDLLVELDDNNLKKIVHILKKSGYYVKQPVDPMGIADRQTREDWIRNKHLIAFNFYKDSTGEEVDLMLQNPVTFETANKNCRKIKVEGMTIKVISPDDLMKMKRKAGREVDKLDIETLKEIKRLEKRMEKESGR